MPSVSGHQKSSTSPYSWHPKKAFKAGERHIALPEGSDEAIGSCNAAGGGVKRRNQITAFSCKVSVYSELPVDRLQGLTAASHGFEP